MRRLVAEQRLPHERVNPVCANEDIGVDADAVLEGRFDMVSALHEPHQPVPYVQPFGRKRGNERRQQVSAMRLVVGKPESLDNHVAERGAEQRAPVIPAPLVERERPHAHRR